MVFLSFTRFVGRTGYDVQFKRHKVFKMTGTYYGRRRNCYSIAIKFLQKALLFTTHHRKIRPAYMHNLRMTRFDAACNELNTNAVTVKTNLVKCDVNLHTSVLSDLAIWEPRTFKCLTEIAQTKHRQEAPEVVKERLTAPDNVITRGML